MPNINLKLKQASAVLGVTAKDLQNLVQLKVINPPRLCALFSEWTKDRSYGAPFCAAQNEPTNPHHFSTRFGG
jgi:hypothetical protein